MPRSHRPSRSLRTIGAAALAVGALLVTTGAPAAAAPTADGTEALTWLAGQLDNANGVFVYDSGFGNFTDYGLTLDAVIALALGGTGTTAVTEAATVFSTQTSNYITGSATPTTDRFAGAIAKTLLATQLVLGSGVGTIDGFDLEAELRNRIDTTATATKGRLRDVSSFGDFSNGFTQGLGVLALSRTTSGVPAPVLAFLLDQQCPGGGFRVAFDKDADFDGVADAGSTAGCVAASESDPDATALALQALLAVPTSPAVTTARTSAVTYLEAAAAALPNANSIGLAGQALRAAAGRTTAADAQATKVAALQFPSGSIALNTAARAAAESASTPQALWRNTSQGVLALGLGPLAPVQAPPTTTTTTTAPTTTTTAAPGATTTTVATSTSSSTSSTVAATTSTTTSSGSLPRTGSALRDQLAIALLLLGAGAVVTGQVMVRQRPQK